MDGHRDIASTMVYLKGVRNRDIQARLNKGSLAAFACNRRADSSNPRGIAR